MKVILRNKLPFLFILLMCLAVFRNFIFKGLLPIPADILVGAYYPWLDYKWGYVVGVPVKNPLPSDIISILYPWRVLGMEIFKSGVLPLWDATSLLGTPLLANFQAALLNPLNVLFLIFSSPLAWSIEVVLQPIFISITTYFFLKNLKVGSAAAVFGGVAFAFSGFSIVWMEYNTIGFTLGFFPLALLLVDKLVAEPKIHYAFGFGLAIALQILSGYPQISIYTIAFATLYFIFRAFSEKKMSLRHIIVYLLGLGTALGLSAIQLLPSLEMIKLSIRPFDNTAVSGGIQFLPWQHFITLFVPDFFGNPATGNYWSVGSYDNFAFSIPAVVLFFALSAFVTKTAWQKKNLIFVLFLIFSLVMATNNIVSQFAIGFDVLGLKSGVAARILFIFDFALIVFAAKEIDKLFSGENTRFLHRLVPLLVYIGIVVGLVVSIIYLRYSLPRDIFNVTGSIPSSDRRVVEAVESILKDLRAGEINNLVALKNAIPPVVLVAIIFGVTFLKRFKKAVIFLSFGVLAVGILAATDKYFTFVPQRFLYPEVDVITELKKVVGTHRFDREQAEIFPSNSWVPYGLKAVSGQNNLLPLTSAKYFTLVNGSYPKPSSRYIDINNIDSPLYDTLDIQYVALLNRHETQSVPDPSGNIQKRFLLPKLEEWGNFKTVRIMENKSNLGMAWFSENVSCLDNEGKTAEILMASDYQLKKLVVVNCQSEQIVKNVISGQVSNVQIFPNKLSMIVDTPAPNYLIISQANYPGWKGFVDGVETNLYSANLALTSLPVPAGSHAVELKYQPESFEKGLKISSITLLGWGIVSFVLVFTKKLRKDDKA